MEDRQIEKLRALIQKETGMVFDERRNYFIKSKIEQRMTDAGYPGFNEYYQELMFGERGGELQAFVEAVTINETYFFRDYPQLQGFAEKVFPTYLKSLSSTNSSIRAWSAACSTGEEPYTLAIILREMLAEEKDKRWSVSVDATDINRSVLAFAQRGVYGARSMKDTPLEYRQRYFDFKNGEFQVKDSLKEDVKFSLVNLSERAEMRKMRGYDFVFCRNVLIYFDEEGRRKVVASLYDALRPGGYLFLGHSESIARITTAFELKSIGGFLCYRKPL